MERSCQLAGQSVQATGPALFMSFPLPFVAKALVRQDEIGPVAVGAEFQRNLRFMHVGLRLFPRPSETQDVRGLDAAILPSDEVRVIAILMFHADAIRAP